MVKTIIVLIIILLLSVSILAILHLVGIVNIAIDIMFKINSIALGLAITLFIIEDIYDIIK